MTPHIVAKKNEIAKIVLIAGDPLRAKFICENFLDDGYKLVSDVRGMLFFTGKYKGYDVTIGGHGMGIPSIGIYSYELFHFYDVDAIIRIGSCGCFLPTMELGELVIASQAISDSSYAKNMQIDVKNQTLNCSSDLHQLVLDTCKQEGLKYYDGLVLSSDAFYGRTNGEYIDNLIKLQKIYAVEMEAFGLYVNALANKKSALTLLTISDSVIDHNKKMDAHQRQTSFINMMKVALTLVTKWYESK